MCLYVRSGVEGSQPVGCRINCEDRHLLDKVGILKNHYL